MIMMPAVTVLGGHKIKFFTLSQRDCFTNLSL